MWSSASFGLAGPPRTVSIAPMTERLPSGWELNRICPTPALVLLHITPTLPPNRTTDEMSSAADVVQGSEAAPQAKLQPTSAPDAVAGRRLDVDVVLRAAGSSCTQVAQMAPVESASMTSVSLFCASIDSSGRPACRCSTRRCS